MKTTAIEWKMFARRPLFAGLSSFVFFISLLAASVPADAQQRQRQNREKPRAAAVKTPPKPKFVPPPAPAARPNVAWEEIESNAREPASRDPDSRLALTFPPLDPAPRPEDGVIEEQMVEPAQRDPQSRLALVFPPPRPRARPDVPLSAAARKRLAERSQGQKSLTLDAPGPDADADQKTAFPPPPAPRPKTLAELDVTEPEAEALLPPAPEPRPSDVEELPPPPEPRPKTQAERDAELPPPPPLPDEAATNACLAALEELGAKFTRVTIVNDNPWCQPGIPLKVTAVEGDINMKFAPPATLDCRMARALLNWLKETVLPAAQEHLKVAPVAISGAGYECRRRFGLTAGLMSEHALANAMDVMGFVMPEGKTINILKEYYLEEPVGVFLQKIRTDACKHFGTVLGPGSDAAHANHFHLDAKERRKSYCQ